MPHIQAIYPRRGYGGEVERFLGLDGNIIRQCVAEKFCYRLDEIALIALPITGEAIHLSRNILPLELIIDLGKIQNQTVDDEASRQFLQLLLERCPRICDVQDFGVWIREMRCNGFAEHRTTPN